MTIEQAKVYAKLSRKDLEIISCGYGKHRERRKINENEFRFSGKTYVAVEKDFCKGCAFWCSELRKRGEIPHCGAQHRKDGRDVIFVEKGTQK